MTTISSSLKSSTLSTQEFIDDVDSKRTKGIRNNLVSFSRSGRWMITLAPHTMDTKIYDSP